MKILQRIMVRDGDIKPNFGDVPIVARHQFSDVLDMTLHLLESVVCNSTCH
jgi:hypothetical protein